MKTTIFVIFIISVPDPNAYPTLVAFKMPKKNSLSFYAHSFLKVHLHHSSKIKSHKEVTKQSFSSWLMVESGAGSGSIQINTYPDADPGGPKTYGSYNFGCGFGSETLFLIVV